LDLYYLTDQAESLVLCLFNALALEIVLLHTRFVRWSKKEKHSMKAVTVLLQLLPTWYSLNFKSVATFVFTSMTQWKSFLLFSKLFSIVN